MAERNLVVAYRSVSLPKSKTSQVMLMPSVPRFQATLDYQNTAGVPINHKLSPIRN
jgi:hypothetical protein